MNLITYRFRIKDSSSKKHLTRMANSVNYVWNYCNEVNTERWNKFYKTYSAYELNSLTSGCSELLGLNAQTIQAVCEQFDVSRAQRRKVKLAWRSSRKSLGWIPFKARGVKIDGCFVKYYGNVFKFWKSRNVEGAIKCGSFNQDVKGDWFVNLKVECFKESRELTGKEVGIDLGLKTIATLSDGLEFNRDNVFSRYQDRIKKAQRANKKKLFRALNVKVKNSRKDWNHKVTSLIVREYDKIYVGNISSSKLIKTKMAKSVTDAAWSDFKRLLEYKTIRFGNLYQEVNESFSTVTCSICGSRTGPKGQAGLRVRKWKCESCGMEHNRDVNAAINILFSAQGLVRCQRNLVIEEVKDLLRPI